MPRIRRRMPLRPSDHGPYLSVEGRVRLAYGWPPGYDPRHDPDQYRTLAAYRAAIGWTPGGPPDGGPR